jgi:VCBS repeat-containing protein
VTGDLNSTDVDGTDDLWNAQTIASINGYGSLQIGADGKWTYTLDNTNATVNALNTGSPALTDTFTVATADGTSHSVVITINGHTDGVTVPAVFNGTGDTNDNDTLLGVNSSSAPLITGTANGDTINGRTGSSQTADTINALGGDDTVNAGDGGDAVYGGTGDDTIFGGAGNDFLYGQGGNDHLYGEGNNDEIYGGTGNDYLDGGDNTDSKLAGGSGNDTIYGGTNGDTLIGGFGADDLYGDAGNDTFAYIDLRDTGDTIHDWTSGDKIDFSVIDANGAAAGNQAFVFGGTTATAFGVWYSVSASGDATVYVDTDGNTSTAELAIAVLGVTSLASGDFTL